MEGHLPWIFHFIYHYSLVLVFPTFSAAFCSHTRLGLKVNYVQQKNDFRRYLSQHQEPFV